jgi:hypothetical protein
MQEAEFYTAILSELTDSQLTEVVAHELLRRTCCGILYFYRADGVRDSDVAAECASIMSPEVRKYAPQTAEQLRLFAAHASLYEERRRDGEIPFGV